jgi:hypothetical protein
LGISEGRKWRGMHCVMSEMRGLLLQRKEE